MKKNYVMFLFLCAGIFASAQVGINTKTPEATLDVNGNVIVRTVNTAGSAADYDFLVVNSTTNEVQKITGNLAATNVNTTMAKAVESDGVSLLSGGAYAGWERIDFGGGHVPINPGNHFDAATDVYTVPSTGVYAVNFEFRYGNGVQLQLLSFGGSPRVGVLKQGGPDGYTVVDERVFSGANVSLLGIGTLSVTLSSVSMNSLYQFTAGDVLSFEVFRGGISLGLLGDSYTSVTIHKISD